MGRIDFDDLQGAQNYSGQRAYNQSKLANVMFTNELARRLAGTGVTANSVHPGVVRTNFGAEDQAWFFAVISGMVRPLLKTPAQGAQTPIYLASSPDVDGVNGQFFANRKPKTANKAAYDTNVTARFWQVSADLVGMTSG
jgi:NAD(P)-dependent dehydrogenase (short-subunit alcohol dehydrogenase family)